MPWPISRSPWKGRGIDVCVCLSVCPVCMCISQVCVCVCVCVWAETGLTFGGVKICWFSMLCQQRPWPLLTVTTDQTQRHTHTYILTHTHIYSYIHTYTTHTHTHAVKDSFVYLICIYILYIVLIHSNVFNTYVFHFLNIKYTYICLLRIFGKRIWNESFS